MARSTVRRLVVSISAHKFYIISGCVFSARDRAAAPANLSGVVDLAHHRKRTSPAKVQLDPCKLTTLIRSTCLLSCSSLALGLMSKSDVNFDARHAEVCLIPACQAFVKGSAAS